MHIDGVCLYIILAIMNGMLIGLSRAVNGYLSMSIGPFKASFWNHIVGFLFISVILAFNMSVMQDKNLLLGIENIRFNINAHQNLYLYVGGVFGALFVAVNSYVFPRLGAVKTALLVISGQMISSVVIDSQSGVLNVLMLKALGVLLILCGVYLSKKQHAGLEKTECLKTRISNTMMDSQVESLLNDRSYHIEFNGHLTNHNKHAVVALWRLGVSPDNIDKYYQNYANLTPYGYPLEAARGSTDVIDQTNWKDFLGKRKNYSAYYDFFDREERRLSKEGVLKYYLPELLPGWVGSLTHAAIHLGWSLDIDNRCMMIEGLAYMAFSYISCHPERASAQASNTMNDKSVFDSLLRIAISWETCETSMKKLVEDMMVGNSYPDVESHPELVRSGLQFRVARMLGAGIPMMYDTPAWLHECHPETIWRQMHYAMNILYMVNPGDFLILHLITSMHAMEQVMNYYLPNKQKDVIHYFWMGILGIIFQRGEFPGSDTLRQLHEKYENSYDDDKSFYEEPSLSWKSIIDRAVLEEEEHNPKLVYVLYRLWQDNNRSLYRIAASHFTTTPELPASFELAPTIN